MRTAVLLAAGRGARMGALTATTPKPLLSVGGRPIMEWILRGLAGAGVERAVVVIGYLGEQIERTFGTGTGLNLRLEYVRQGTAEGTARALLLTQPLVGAETFLVSWGDILVDGSLYGELVRAFESRPSDALLAVNPVDDPWQGAAVYLDEEWRVTKLEEKPPRGTARTTWNNAGLFVLRPAVFEYARRLTPSERGEYELPQALAQMVSDGLEVRAVPVGGFWSDVGTPEALRLADRHFSGGG